MGTDDLLVNLGLALFDAVALAGVIRRPEERRALALGWCLATLVLVLAMLLARDAFAGARAAAWVGFVHAPVVLGIAAASGWRPAILGSAALVLLGVGVDAFLVEPHGIVVNRYTVETDKLAAPLRSWC